MTSLLFTHGAHANCEKHEGHVVKGRVSFVSSVPFAVSGYLSTWIKMKISDENVSHDAYIQFLDKAAFIPKVGDICELKYHFGVVSGIVGDESLNGEIDNSIIVDEIDCKKT
jgi:hypothetical protein